MNPERLKQLQLPSEAKERSTRSLWIIFVTVGALTTIAIYYAWPRLSDKERIVVGGKTGKQTAGVVSGQGSKLASSGLSTNSAAVASGAASDSVLTASGYIVNRERVELSPRFLGVVKWIGVKKGDTVTNGQVVVLLDDAEYKARLTESEGRLAAAQTALAKAQLDYERVIQLSTNRIESKQAEDDARLRVESARAGLKESQGQYALAKTYLNWTIIRSPIDGVVLEKLVDPNELVVPQSFGGTRGPSTALIALADPKDLQVEIDLNESDLSKVFPNQACRVSPEAYLEKTYDGYVAEIAPEANRQKGTLQVKVQIRHPDRFLTPELSAKVDFLGRQATAGTESTKAATGNHAQDR